MGPQLFCQLRIRLIINSGNPKPIYSIYDFFSLLVVLIKAIFLCGFYETLFIVRQCMGRLIHFHGHRTFKKDITMLISYILLPLQTLPLVTTRAPKGWRNCESLLLSRTSPLVWLAKTNRTFMDHMLCKCDDTRSENEMHNTTFVAHI